MASTSQTTEPTETVESEPTEPSEGAEQGRDHEIEDIPEAPICGKLATYLFDQESLSTIRMSCRRVGLELEAHSRTDIPNPSAHRGHVVIIEIPPAEEKRFQWIARLKKHPHDINVVLLLQHPSRPQVVHGVATEADVILGVPFTEPQLSKKLAELVRKDEPE